MRIVLRYLADYRSLWRVWVPLLILACIAPILAIAAPLVEKQLIDGVVLARRVDRLPGIALLYSGLWLFSTVNFVIASGLRAYLAERLAMHLRQRLFTHSGKLSLAFADRQHSGRTVSLFVNDVPSVTDLFSPIVVEGVIILLAMILALVAMVILNWELALAAIVGPALAMIVSAFVTRPLRPAARRVQEKAAQVVERIQEHLGGMREITAFGQVHRQELRFQSTLQELLRLRMRVTVIDTAIKSGTSIVSLVVTLSILILGAYLVIKGRTTLGTVIAMRSLFGLLFQPTTQLAGLFSSTQRALGAADRIYAFLDEEPTVKECANPRTLADVIGEVQFDGVSFAYESGRTVIHNVSMRAQPGEMIALVGPSGAGKSTLMSLLGRFYDPTHGAILLDGVDLRALSLQAVRSHVGIVFQDTFLFDTTIRENILLGRDDAEKDDVIAAAQAANAWEFIEQMPSGLDTVVGERGVRLSEGQKQRIAIARAFIRGPHVLILDEPTSALDARSEHLLQSALFTLMKGRTTFVIAHRLATIQRADRIMVLDHGRIVEQGSHRQLLQHPGVYRELFELQFGGRHNSSDTASPESFDTAVAPFSK
ncbi:MAG: ABC transporter ATP-binding protein [Chloroflexota bacterium]